MKIIKNTSRHSTRKLKSIISATHRYMARTNGKLKRWDRLRVKCRGKEDGYSGRAFVDTYGDEWDVFLSLAPDLTDRRIIRIVFHELMHSYGYLHKHGCDPVQGDIDAIEAGLPWNKKAPTLGGMGATG